MPRVDFYEVKGGRWEVDLCALAEEALEGGARAYLRCASEALAREFDDLLWTFRDGSFVAHGLWQGQEICDEPLAVGWKPGNPNRATCLLLACDGGAEEVSGFERVIDLAPVDQPALRDRARVRFKTFRAAGFVVNFHPAAP